MKTLFGLVATTLALGGCVAVPVEPGPVVYAAPPPAVVVQPYVYYGGYYGGHYARRAPYWRRGWR